MANFEELQTHAKEKGYKISKGKGGAYIGNYRGIEFEDDDAARLCDDMDAVAEIAESEDYVLLDEADEDGQSIIEVEIDGDKRQFINISVSAALAEAKEAVLASKPKPAAPRGRTRRTAAAAESLNEAEEAASHAPAPTEASTAWENEVKNQQEAKEAEILPPEGGEKLNALRIDLRAFADVTRTLSQAADSLHRLVSEALADKPVEAEEEKPRGRGRPRRNGR